MDYSDVLTKKEIDIFMEAEKDFADLDEALKEPLPLIDKQQFLEQSMKAGLDSILPNITARYNAVMRLIRKGKEYYKLLKSQLDKKDTTHEFITDRALDLIQHQNVTTRKKLKVSCVAPDRNKKMNELVFEGHFYGKTRGNARGNFLQKCFSPEILATISWLDDIEETAVSNFSRHYKGAFRNGSVDLTCLGWAAHYIQDLTAPHHVGNLAVFFELFFEKTMSHYAFEKYAKKKVYEHPKAFQGKASVIFDEIKTSFQPGKPEEFAKLIYRRASVVEW